MHPDWPNDPLSAAQVKVLARLAELGSDPYGWTARHLGTSGATLEALSQRMLIHGGNIYGGRTRSYIIEDRGRERLKAIAMEARRGETENTGSTAEGGDSAGRKASPKDHRHG